MLVRILLISVHLQILSLHQILSTTPGSTGPQEALSSSAASSTIPTAILSKLSNALNQEIRDAVLTAVHGELLSKDARRRNFISGLPSKPGVSDMALVHELVETEFGYRPLIALTRRLGRG